MAYDRILDYVIEQANREDANNLQFEQDILFEISRAKDKAFARIVEYGVGFNSMVEMNQIIKKADSIIAALYTETVRILLDKFQQYYKRGYDNTTTLIDVGLDAEARLYSLHEISSTRDDEVTVDFIQNHAFEMLQGYDSNIISRLRSELGNLFLNKSTDRASVRNVIEKTLGVNRSKAEEIAQNELSRAYNYGVLQRLYDYEAETGERAQKYWHGFLYSAKTCGYCKERIGNIYDIDDDSEVLPAHSRCRCIWLPVLSGWDKPISKDVISRANMLNTAYSTEQIYDRINSRLGISYGDLISPDTASQYLAGDRSPTTMSGIANARQSAIDRTKAGFNITQDNSGDQWANKFNQQMNFWKDTVAMAMVDNDTDLLRRCSDGIKTVVALPWNGDQLAKWNELLRYIDDFLNRH